MNRLQRLLQFFEEDPQDAFLLYSLAQEYSKLGELDKSLNFYLELKEVDPKYVGMYYHLGKLYEKLGQVEEAKLAYNAGMQISREVNDQHALSELNGAYQLLLSTLDD